MNTQNIVIKNSSGLFILLVLLFQIETTAYANTNVSDDILDMRSAIEESTLTANAGTVNDLFGFSVSLSGSKALVGSPGNESGSGAAYIFDLIENVWVQSAKLEASDKAMDDKFGYSVSLSGNRALIGAYLDDDNASNSGSAYIFELSGDTWIQTAKINSNDAAMDDQFGFSVSLLGDRALIGAYSTDENFDNSGSAYVFDLSAGVWNQTTKLLSDSPAVDDWLGYSVSLNVDRALLGARLDGENGNNTGSATIFDLTMNVWSQTIELFADDAAEGDQFGVSVSLSNDRALIGAPLNDENGLNSGAAYVFDLISTNWVQTQKLMSTDIAANDFFGQSVNLEDNQAIVGSLLDDDNGVDSGSATIFDLSLDTWIQTAKLTASTGMSNDSFGVSVSISGFRSLVGAHLNDENGIDFGSAFVYKIDEPPVAINDTVIVFEGAQATIVDVMGNDIDADGGNNKIIATTQALHGMVVNSPLLLSYQPDSGYCNDNDILDTFSYTLNGGSSAEVSVTVICTYTIGGTLSGLITGNNVVLQDSNGNNLQLNNNGGFTFTNPVIDLSHYSITVFTEPDNPNQNCIIENASGIIADSDVNNLLVTCNAEPIMMDDNFNVIEDGILTTLAGDIFDNDSDVENDNLIVANPGIYSTNGIGGLIFIEADGSFEYLPNDDLFGQSSYTFDVSDGFNVVSSSLTFDIEPVNDSPNFNFIGNIDATSLITENNKQIIIQDFATNFVFGPINESTQQVQQFNVQVYSDFNQVLNSVTVDNNGVLSLDFSLNYGAAIIHLSMQDDGGTTNNGEDTSSTIEFVVTYTDLIYANGFEIESHFRLMDYIKSIRSQFSSSQYPRYVQSSDSVEFLGHTMHLNSESFSDNLMIVRYWIEELLLKEMVLY